MARHDQGAVMQGFSAAVLGFVTFSVIICAGAVDESEYPEGFAQVNCKQLKKCDRASYDENYASKDECIAEPSAFMDDAMDVLDFFGDYDPEAGGECLRAMKAASCEEWDDGEFECPDLYN